VKIALLGKSLEHSISPELHKLLWQILSPGHVSPEEKIEYIITECESREAVAEWMKTAYGQGFHGANVTAPYKGVVSELVTQSSEEASAASSVNTLLLSQGSAKGYLTDGQGLALSLKRELPNCGLSGIAWIVYGAGGAARAVVEHLVRDWKPKHVTLAIRTESESSRNSAKLIVELIQSKYPDVEVALDKFGIIEDRGTEGILHLNCTPIGQRGRENWGNNLPTFIEDDIAIDLVYNPIETEFITAARSVGAKTLGGLGMLIEQAALSEWIWLTDESRKDSPLTEHQYFALKEQLSSLLH